MRVEQQRHPRRERDQVPAAAVQERQHEARRGQQRQHDDEGVHPRLLRVVVQERAGGDPDRGQHAGAAVEDGVAGPVGDGHGDQREDRATARGSRPRSRRRSPSSRAAAGSTAAASRPSPASTGCRGSRARRSRPRSPRRSSSRTRGRTCAAAATRPSGGRAPRAEQEGIVTRARTGRTCHRDGVLTPAANGS